LPAKAEDDDDMDEVVPQPAAEAETKENLGGAQEKAGMKKTAPKQAKAKVSLEPVKKTAPARRKLTTVKNATKSTKKVVAPAKKAVKKVAAKKAIKKVAMKKAVKKATKK
jgi:hypothetical protein